jgi:hypothetical protein
VSENASTHLIAEPGNAAHVIDWDNLEILPIAEDQIGAALPLMDENEMYAFVGLAAEDERAEQERQPTENEKEGADTTAAVPMDLQGADLLADDVILGEESVFYDLEDPPMNVGSVYASMKEFRAAVRHHAIKGQFELGTEKSCKKVFRGYCKAADCPWAIVARTMRDEQQVRVYFANFAFLSNFNLTFVPSSQWKRICSSPFNHVRLLVQVTLNKEEHFCPSTAKVRTKMANYHWVAEQAIPFLMKDPNMGAAIHMLSQLHVHCI